MGIFARYRELASGIEKIACFRGLDEVIFSLRPQYEDGTIEILEIATECDVVILTETRFSNICELDDGKGKVGCNLSAPADITLCMVRRVAENA
jgi:hypothetical protein